MRVSTGAWRRTCCSPLAQPAPVAGGGILPTALLSRDGRVPSTSDWSRCAPCFAGLPGNSGARPGLRGTLGPSPRRRRARRGHDGRRTLPAQSGAWWRGVGRHAATRKGVCPRPPRERSRGCSARPSVASALRSGRRNMESPRAARDEASPRCAQRPARCTVQASRACWCDSLLKIRRRPPARGGRCTSMVSPHCGSAPPPARRS